MSDLFTSIGALFTKEEVEEVPSAWVLHRFLASDPDFAIFARHLQPWIYDDAMLFTIWQRALPRARKAPYFHYVAPKRPASATELVERVMEVYGYNRQDAEEAVVLLEEMESVAVTSGHAHPMEVAVLRDLHSYLGLEWTDAATD